MAGSEPWISNGESSLHIQIEYCDLWRRAFGRRAETVFRSSSGFGSSRKATCISAAKTTVRAMTAFQTVFIVPGHNKPRFTRKGHMAQIRVWCRRVHQPRHVEEEIVRSIGPQIVKCNTMNTYSQRTLEDRRHGDFDSTCS